MSSCHHGKSLKFYPQVFHFSFLLHFDTFVLSSRCKSRNFHIWIDATFPSTLDFDAKLQVPPLSKPFRWECRQSDRCLFMPTVCMMVYRFRYNFAPSKVTVILPRPSIAWQSTKTFASFPFGIYIYSTSFAFCEDRIFSQQRLHEQFLFKAFMLELFFFSIPLDTYYIGMSISWMYFAATISIPMFFFLHHHHILCFFLSFQSWPHVVLFALACHAIPFENVSVFFCMHDHAIACTNQLHVTSAENWKTDHMTLSNSHPNTHSTISNTRTLAHH